MYGIMPREGAHLPIGVALGEIVVGDPYPSFQDDPECSLANLSFLADSQLAEAQRMEELPEVTLKITIIQNLLFDKFLM